MAAGEVTTEILDAPRAAAPPVAARRRWPLQVLLHNLVAGLVVLAVWQVATWLVRSVFFPSPLQVVRAMADLWVNGDVTGNSLLTHIRWSLLRLLAGFSMGVLLGDVNGNRTVSNGDVGLIQAQVGAAVTQSNFRDDVNVNGVLSNGDVATAQAQVGAQLPP